ncbi:glycosyltransferase family 2 protein [Mesorhizobium sp. WSM4303]|uniref:glycosyltransferase family 2 protein n=1 Tax=unclassified Mesorhizobium TaxID=325217 RepID=UPI00115D9DCA|nr:MULTISPECIES: glycosyltransferase family A protein [unclassified Mesorhizobium]TRC98814.1 glycosyltransferase family 2 protein [Mesorhizobium sp. WSM4306]TRD07136.1 glycosyltransferase family 2 protein [Mesorhizobium sp. WSM4303]
MTASPSLAVIVIGLRAPAKLVDAVRSLTRQDTPLEIVVVNSGGGDAKALLSGAGVDVPVIEVSHQVFVGAARNIGIAATKAPFVAFLADDCLACPGWADARIRHHTAGAATVASAISNSHPESLVACAAYLALFARRLPGLPAELALRYGVSFDRSLFDRFGLFDENIASAEDTDFLDRLPSELTPIWDPAIKTIHSNETRLVRLVVDQFKRGYRGGAYRAATTTTPPLRLARGTFSDRRQIRKLARTGLLGPELDLVIRSMPLMVLAVFAKSIGVYFGARHHLKKARLTCNDH